MNRISTIEVLIEQPYNINQLSRIIKIDYIVIRYHIHVLEKNLITKEGEKYGILFLYQIIWKQGWKHLEK
ncbi:MAG: hypothetical protein AB7F29_00385 [Candidatus Nitrosocosmicus sp.]